MDLIPTAQTPGDDAAKLSDAADATLIRRLHRALARREATSDGPPPVAAEGEGRARHVRDGGPYTWTAPHGWTPGDVRPGAGLLDGWTLAVKDLIALAGRPIGAGSALRDHAAAETVTAEVVARLISAGAEVAGTTALHEFAFGTTGINRHTGTPDNPNAPGRITGGSSSGSAAAVADGSARLSLGTDTGGSIRIPAALCGVAGFKPSFGLYPAAGVFPLSASLDHVGLHARNVADLCLAHRALGHTVGEAVGRIRFGVLTSDVEAADGPVREAMERALARLGEAGHDLVPVEGPAPELVFATSTAIMFTEAAAVHEPTLGSLHYGPDVYGRLATGAMIGGTTYHNALIARQGLIAQVRALLADVDALIGPTVPLLAPTVEAATQDGALPARLVANTRLANVTGLPAVSLPLPTAGPPIGLQLTGLADSDVLGLAAVVESVVGGSQTAMTDCLTGR
ncbi:amidase [Nonomuraea sp. CA-141351]|uniref:amidase n=1 Tax=Nonomuraea sp. CA-141351 TaxID=3239996 RepID=UPI003D8D48E6